MTCFYAFQRFLTCSDMFICVLTCSVLLFTLYLSTSLLMTDMQEPRRRSNALTSNSAKVTGPVIENLYIQYLQRETVHSVSAKGNCTFSICKRKLKNIFQKDYRKKTREEFSCQLKRFHHGKGITAKEIQPMDEIPADATDFDQSTPASRKSGLRCAYSFTRSLRRFVSLK